MRIFRISFFNQGQVYELHAESVRQGELYGFIEIERPVFGEHSSVVIDPSEERLRDELAGVKRIMVPIHAVIRIDEVEKQGQNKIRDLEGAAKVTPFPTAIYTPDKGPRGPSK
jgi:hypothetical protein